MSRNLRFALLFVALITGSTAARAQLGSADTQLFTLGMPGTGASLQSDAEFGGALAAGDFDCDGFDDLAVGVPGSTSTATSIPGRCWCSTAARPASTPWPRSG